MSGEEGKKCYSECQKICLCFCALPVTCSLYSSGVCSNDADFKKELDEKSYMICCCFLIPLYLRTSTDLCSSYCNFYDDKGLTPCQFCSVCPIMCPLTSIILMYSGSNFGLLEPSPYENNCVITYGCCLNGDLLFCCRLVCLCGGCGQYTINGQNGVHSFQAANGLGGTALHGAAKNNKRALASMLLLMGADPDIKSEDGKSALDVALDKTHVETVALLAKSRSVRSTVAMGDLKGLIELMGQSGGSSVEKVIENLNKPIGQKGTTLMHIACHRGHVHVAQYLLKIGADPLIKDNDGKTPFDMACEYGHLDVMKWFVDELNISLDRQECLYLSLSNKHYHTVKYLFEHGALLSEHISGVDLMDIHKPNKYPNSYTSIQHDHVLIRCNDRRHVFDRCNVCSKQKGCQFFCSKCSWDICGDCITKENEMLYPVEDLVKKYLELGGSVLEKKVSHTMLEYSFFSWKKCPNFQTCKYLTKNGDVECSGCSYCSECCKNNTRCTQNDGKTVFQRILDAGRNVNYPYFPLAALSAKCFELWFHLIQQEGVDIDGYLCAYPELADAKDVQGRGAEEVATAKNKKAIKALYLWHGKYRLTASKPEHTSATCQVYRAVDEVSGDSMVPVALKVMRVREQWLREVEFRQHLQFNSEYVIEVMASFEPVKSKGLASTNELVSQATSSFNSIDKYMLGSHSPNDIKVLTIPKSTMSKEQAEGLYCLAMPLGERNLYVCLKQERWANRNMPEVMHVFKQILTAVDHVHKIGYIHGDLKPLNLVRMDGKWIVIDMDACARIGIQVIGNKASTAFIPPEAIHFNPATGVICLRSEGDLERLGLTGVDGVDPLIAHESFDIWSLGCILYLLASSDGRPLFQGNQDDNLSTDPRENDSLHELFEWSAEMKARKLAKVQDPTIRNLLSLILTKDPTKRPSTIRIFAHPAVSGSKVVRMFGVAPKFDIFLSYRVASDAKFVEIIYNLLSAKGWKVFWDKVCLENGQDWEEGFCAGLVDSRTFLCILSKDGINNPNVAWQNFSKLEESSNCDNVYLEHRLALELKELGYIDAVFPVMIGNIDPIVGIQNFFSSGGRPNGPSVHVKKVEEKLRMHMDRQGLGTPLQENRSVKSVLDAILSCQGKLIEGDSAVAFDCIVEYIEKGFAHIDAKEHSVGNKVNVSIDNALLFAKEEEIRQINIEKSRIIFEYAQREADLLQQYAQREADLLEANRRNESRIQQLLAGAGAEVGSSARLQQENVCVSPLHLLPDCNCNHND